MGGVERGCDTLETDDKDGATDEETAETAEEKTGDGKDTAAVQTCVATRSIHQRRYYVHVRTAVLFTLNSHEDYMRLDCYSKL